VIPVIKAFFMGTCTPFSTAWESRESAVLEPQGLGTHRG
jgi:hypothetical protein